MSTAPQRQGPALYRPPLDRYDEMVAPNGSVRRHWRPLVDGLAEMGLDSQAERWRKVERLLDENGLTFHVHGEGSGAARPLRLDAVPYILSAADWRILESALIQRARLLNAVIADIYGDQDLLTRGLIPGPLLLANPAFLRPCYGAVPRGGVYLHQMAVDLARAPDGAWWVLGERTQAPEGRGFALENRIALSHCYAEQFRDTPIQRLAGFFRAFDQALVGLSPREEPRIAVLTRGPSDPNYFAHAYLARYLGYSLAEGGDLTVRDRRVFLKTVDGLKQVDVILRKVACDEVDPLELRPDSAFGVAGLIDAWRAGHVAIANAPGSSVMETHALAGFLPPLCRHLLSEELALPSVATWWCGEPGARAHALANLDALAVTPAFGRYGEAPVPADRAKLAREIETRGHFYIAREAVALPTVPVLEGGAFRPAAATLRVFIAHDGGDFQVMPGGLAQVSSGDAGATSATHRPDTSKDVWVLSDAPLEQAPSLRPRPHAVALRRTGKDLPSRAADNLFWLGRYAERAEQTCRLMRTILSRLVENGRPAGEYPAMVQLIGPLAVKAGLDRSAAQGEFGGPNSALLRGQLRALLAEPCPYGLQETLGHLARTAGLARDRLSVDAWRTLSTLRADRFGPASEPDLAGMLDPLEAAIRNLAAFSGMESENMTRSHGWRFLDMGRRIERGEAMTEAVQGLLGSGDPEEDGSLTLLLELADSFMTYRSRYLTTPMLAPVLDLLVLDEMNPRSVGFQIAALSAHIGELPGHRPTPPLSAEQRLVTGMLAELRLSDIHALCRAGASGERQALLALLGGLSQKLSQFSDQLARTYFSHAQSASGASLLQRGL